MRLSTGIARTTGVGAFSGPLKFFRVPLAAALLILPLGASGVAQTPLSVTVIGEPDDPRVAAVQEAVAFWNRQLE